MVPEAVSGERGDGLFCIPHKAPSGVRVESQEERHEQMVGVPEGLEGLLANAMMGGRVHEHHAEEHDMASDSAGLSEVHLHRSVRADLILLDVIKTRCVSSSQSVRGSLWAELT